jgi:lipoate-protein ligase A
MIFVVDGSHDGDENMRRDIALLEDAEQGYAGGRIYYWNSVWVTLGRFQTPEETLLQEINYTLRPTGGAAVLHGHDLTIGLAVPLEQINCTPREVKTIYRIMVTPIVNALNAIKISATLGEDAGEDDIRSSPFCFSQKSRNDVLSLKTGNKICGVAMRVTNKAALIQASIPVSTPLVDPETVIKDAQKMPWIPFEPRHFETAFSEEMLNLDWE